METYRQLSKIIHYEHTLREDGTIITVPVITLEKTLPSGSKAESGCATV